MNRIAFAFAVAALGVGCSPKTCETSSQCGSSEVCGSGATCQAVTCNDTYFAVDPSDGSCRPLPTCGNRDDVRAWATCGDPCRGLTENSCIADPRCQPSYTTEAGNPCTGIDKQGGVGFTPAGGFIGNTGCGGARNFVGCRANALRVDPCAGLDESGCKSNPQCVGFQWGPCDCAGPAPCTCPAAGWECRVKSCSDYISNAECAQHTECTSNPGPISEGDFPPPGADAGVDQPFFGCFDKGSGSCFSMDEGSCVRHPECHPVGGTCYCPPGATCVCGGGQFLFCEPDDGLARCNGDSDCGGGQRCSNDEVCAPPIGGIGFGGFGQPVNGGPIPPDTTGAASLDAPTCAGMCVPQGCTGYGENHCNTDPTCQPVYLLNCSPYGGGFEGAPICANGQPGGVDGCGPCEPSFVRCEDRAPGSEVDPEVSVMERDPGVIDSPAFSFANVMAALAGGKDPAAFVDQWLQQLTVDVTVGGKLAPARPQAAAYLAGLPRLGDGRLDLDHIGFQVTSLSNRIDLAGPHDCGEARITYALAGGLTDRFHRMTVIVELRQPDDGSRCEATARRWIALGKLKGEALTFGFIEIFGPLIAPEYVNQIRTNEFLVGTGAFDQRTGLPTPWELREFHLGADGGLHLVPSKQAVDPTVSFNPDFADWIQQNHDAIKAQHAIVPDQFLAVTSSENGSRIGIQQVNPDDFLVEQSLNRMACAGCHTTETNSAFAHVGERFKGTGKAKISEFLRLELPKRGQNLWRIGQGRLDEVARSTKSFVH